MNVSVGSWLVKFSLATRPRVEGVAGRGIRQRVYNHQKRNEVPSLLSEDEKKTTSLKHMFLKYCKNLEKEKKP